MTNIIKNTIVGAALTLFSGAFLISAASLYHDADRRRIKAGAESCWICKESARGDPQCFKIVDGKDYGLPPRICNTDETSSFPRKSNSPDSNKDYPKIKLMKKLCPAPSDLENKKNCGHPMRCTPKGDLCGSTNG